MNHIELWNKFIKENKELVNEDYSAWTYGDETNELVTLTLSGAKTANATLYDPYRIDGIPLPMVGDYSVILKEDEETAACIIKNKKVTLVPFNKVTASHASKEGENDKSLESWKELYKEIFTNTLKEYNLEFNDEVMVVLEEFEIVFKA